MKLSKKFIVVIAFAAIAALVLSTQTFSKKDFATRNVEALAQPEPGVGRWRTVGCGGYGFGNWMPYCCPTSDYNNCPRPGYCGLTVYGC